jgi:Domain of unknown function (DUF397)
VSSFCEPSRCVEVRRVGDEIQVRDSKNPDQPHLTFDLDEWAAFTQGVEAGEFDPRPTTVQEPTSTFPAPARLSSNTPAQARPR